MIIQKDSVILPSPGVIGKIIEEPINDVLHLKAILVLPDTGKVLVINDVGARIWTLLDGERTITAISQILETEYSSPSQDIQLETIDFLSGLLEREIVYIK
jgi:pyrroloquinoline quinone biosynthesis protein D